MDALKAPHSDKVGQQASPGEQRHKLSCEKAGEAHQMFSPPARKRDLSELRQESITIFDRSKDTRFWEAAAACRTLRKSSFSFNLDDFLLPNDLVMQKIGSIVEGFQ
jgi:hypothetical protein